MTIANPGIPAAVPIRVWPRARLRERWRFAVVLAALATLIGVEVAFAYATTVSNKFTDDAVDRTEAVIKQTNLAMAAFGDMEIGYHGYLLTADDTFLATYTAARTTYRDALQ